MRRYNQGGEEIRTIEVAPSLSIALLPVERADIVPAFFRDDPERDENAFQPFLTRAEASEGRGKTAPAAYRAWLSGRMAAKAAAALLWGGPPGDQEIRKNSEGRPDLYRPGLTAGPERPRGWLSISHTRGAAAAVVSRREPVGVDLERADRPVKASMARWAFTGPERRLAEEFSDAGGYLALWCAREAAAKCWGRALLNHLDSVRAARVDRERGLVVVDWLGPPTARAEAEIMVYDEFMLALAFPAEAPAGKIRAEIWPHE
ncbi:MAG: 4'-phosphopantetheinyl transferase superfamily protein [Candidatus Adiutrix sp.]|jgi:phosphopantetheinyl transferase|nr:4'-phosphopantetheinyl transferase superfamily protein [Candidatus Adiutrix sp.]